MKLQTKWKVGTVYWKLAKGQETKGGSKKAKRRLIGECCREQCWDPLFIIYI